MFFLSSFPSGAKPLVALFICTIQCNDINAVSPGRLSENVRPFLNDFTHTVPHVVMIKTALCCHVLPVRVYAYAICSTWNVYVVFERKVCVWKQRCVGLRGQHTISHPTVKQPLKCSLVALQGAASHGHILMSAAATWLCLRGAPKARTVTVTDTEWYRAGEQREWESWGGKET